MQNITIIFLILVAGLTFSRFDERLDARNEQVTADGVANVMTQGALAQSRFVANPATILAPTYAGTFQELFDAGFLPVWDPDPAYGFDFPTPSGFVVTYETDTEGFAADVALRFGKLSTVTTDGSGNAIISVGFASPIELAVFELYVKRSGDTMFGTLEMVTGSGASLVMNDNLITSEASITIKNNAGTGLIDTDIGNINVLTVQDFLIAN